MQNHNPRRLPQAILLALLCTAQFSVSAHAQESPYPSRITFVNGTGENALVKLVGPSSLTISVPDKQSATVHVAPGSYYILTRYGSPRNYRYSKGDPFSVRQIGDRYSAIEITLHKVPNGNYHTRDSSQNEFNSR